MVLNKPKRAIRMALCLGHISFFTPNVREGYNTILKRSFIFFWHSRAIVYNLLAGSFLRKKGQTFFAESVLNRLNHSNGQLGMPVAETIISVRCEPPEPCGTSDTQGENIPRRHQALPFSRMLAFAPFNQSFFL